MATVEKPEAKMSEFGFPLPTGDPSVLPVVARFVSGHQVTDGSDSQLRAFATLITGAATAWRMPDVSTSCPQDR